MTLLKRNQLKLWKLNTPAKYHKVLREKIGKENKTNWYNWRIYKSCVCLEGDSSSRLNANCIKVINLLMWAHGEYVSENIFTIYCVDCEFGYLMNYGRRLSSIRNLNYYFSVYKCSHYTMFKSHSSQKFAIVTTNRCFHYIKRGI